MAIGVTFSLAACKNEEPAKEVKKKSSITKEEAEEEVKYWSGKGCLMWDVTLSRCEVLNPSNRWHTRKATKDRTLVATVPAS